MTCKASGLLPAALLALVPLVAEAQSFRCTDKDGKKHYGSTIPPQCEGRIIEQLSAQGVVIRRVDPEGEERERAAKQAEIARKREEEAATRESSRRNRALLATYTSEKDIDDARARALAENKKAILEVEKRIADIKKRQAAYDKEMEFYVEGAAKSDKKSKPAAGKGGPKPPPKLVEDVRTAEVDLKAQENLLSAKKKEVESINAKYDEDKQRFQELTKPATPRRGGSP